MKFGKHEISEMSEDHCWNSIRYIFKRNPQLSPAQKDVVNALQNRIKELGGRRIEIMVVDMDTGEVVENFPV